ncbi:MAG: hypothetical protein ABIT37_01630 [Luteolibacter sp.]
MSEPTASAGPTVKLTPTFKVGETVIEIATGEEMKILEIVNENLRIGGRAGLMPPTGVEKKI